MIFKKHIAFTVFSMVFILMNVILDAQDIKEIYIDCDPDDFSYIYENYEEDIYIPVYITYEGNTWTDVLMRIRGDSSREYPKKSLKLQFESESFITGRTTVNFNAEYHDLSYMHSVISTILFKKAGIASPEMEHVRLYLNDVFLGLYIMTENVDEQFLSSRGFDPNGNLYKASRDGACLSIFDNVFYHWDLKSGDDPYRDGLTGLIMELNDVDDENYLQFVQSEMNYSNITVFIAMNMLLSNGSTYYHNYFMYRDDASDGLWFIFPWDLDRTFSDYGKWLPFHRSSGFWTPDNPLLEKSLMDDFMFADIRDNVETIKDTIFNAGFLYPLMDSIQNAIAASVMEDTTDNIPDMITWQEKIANDKQFIPDRYDQLVYQFDHIPSTFRILRKEGYFPPGQDIQFNWQPSVDTNGNPVTYTFFLSQDVKFEDPGTIEISDITENMINTITPEVEGKYYYKVEATDGVNSVPGFDTYNQLFICTDIPEIVINEINYNSNASSDPGDWVEFHNRGAQPADLGGWKFKDQNDSHIYSFPAGTIIDSSGYLVLCRDTSQFYTQFPLSIPTLGNLDFGFDSKGEILRLYDDIEYPIDAVWYRNEYPWPEEPDGNGPTLELLNPGLDNALGYNWAASYDYGTPGEQNGTYSPDFIGEQRYPGDVLHVFPNPCDDHLNVEISSDLIGSLQIKIIDITGRLHIHKSCFAFSGETHHCTLQTVDLPPGLYCCIVSASDMYTYSFFVKQR